MKKTIVVYGSSTGTCEGLAQNIAQRLAVPCINVTELTEAVVAENENLILGTSTWGDGDVQDDWYDALSLLENMSLVGKTVALFGCGDAASYPETFCGGMAVIKRAIDGKGVTFVGDVSAADYDYADSEAVENGRFVGLALDEMNEDDKTEGRISAWVEEIMPAL